MEALYSSQELKNFIRKQRSKSNSSTISKLESIPISALSEILSRLTPKQIGDICAGSKLMTSRCISALSKKSIVEEQIPIEIFEQIFLQLSYDEIEAFCLASKTMRNICDDPLLSQVILKKLLNDKEHAVIGKDNNPCNCGD